jgi:hypothetical protein
MLPVIADGVNMQNRERNYRGWVCTAS